MKIAPGDVGQFKSADQTKAYDRALEIKNEIQNSEEIVKGFDDVANVDFNSKVRGDVLVDKGWGMKDMHLKFNPVTGHVKEFEADKSSSRGTMEHYYKSSPLEKLGKFVSSFCPGMGSVAVMAATSAAGAAIENGEPMGKEIYKLRDGNGITETVMINNKTGVITYDMHDHANDF